MTARRPGRLERGWRVREILKQPQLKPIPVAEQIAALLAVNGGALDVVPIKEISKAEGAVRKEVKERLSDLCKRIESGDKLSLDNFNTILKSAQEAVEPMGGKADADH